MENGPGHSFDRLPTAFGRYRLVRLLGRGGMGNVYLAHDTQLDRPIALKMPQLDDDASPHVLQRFFTEARAAAALNHPNICRIHDVGEVDGVPYLTMAYIEGKPLGEFVRLKPPLHRQSALLVWKLAVALQEAHKRGIIHRDLKPANIMIDKRGEPSIMDFGLARRSDKGDARITQTGQILGTPAYMSPEQIQSNPDAIGPASDVYSLGVILYELLARRLPFTGEVMVLLSRVLLDEPPRPSEFCPELDPELESICLKAMAKKSKHRYQSMEDFAAALFDHLQGKTATMSSGSAITRSGSGIRAAGRVSQSGGSRSSVRMGKRSRGKKRSGSGWFSEQPWLLASLFLALLAVPVLLLAMWLVRRGTRSAAPDRTGQPPANVAVQNGPSGDVPVPQGPAKEKDPSPRPSGPGPKLPAAWRDSDFWVLNDKELHQRDDRGWEHWFLFGDPAWTDYDFEVEAEILGGGTEVNIVVRSTSRQQCILAVLGGWENKFHGAYAPGGIGFGSAPGQTKPGQWYRVRVEARGNRFRVLLDDRPLLSFVTDRYPRGQVGVRTSYTSARFRNPRVLAPNGTVLAEGWPDLPPVLTDPRVVEAGKLLDEMMNECLTRFGCSAAALGVARNSVVVHLKAYGFRDKARTMPATPDNLFGIGPFVRPLAHASIRQLAAKGRLNLSDPILKLLNVLPQGKVVDPRVWTITVENLLDERSGWDYETVEKAYAVVLARRINRPAAIGNTGRVAELVAGHLATQPLTAAPGTKATGSGRFDLDVLLNLVSRISGRSPGDYFRHELLGRELTGIAARGSAEARAAAAFNANGIVCASPSAVLALMRKFSADGKPAQRPGSAAGMWDGNTSIMSWRYDGTHVVVLLNGAHREAFSEIGPKLQKILDTMNARDR